MKKKSLFDVVYDVFFIAFILGVYAYAGFVILFLGF